MSSQNRMKIVCFKNASRHNIIKEIQFNLFAAWIFDHDTKLAVFVTAVGRPAYVPGPHAPSKFAVTFCQFDAGVILEIH